MATQNQKPENAVDTHARLQSEFQSIQNVYLDKIKRDLVEKVEKIKKEDAGYQLPNAEYLLGRITWPFVGVRSPAIHFFDGVEGYGTDRILSAVIVHFANEDNLALLHEDYRKDALNSLHYLYEMVNFLMKNNDILWPYANMFHIWEESQEAVKAMEELNDYSGLD